MYIFDYLKLTDFKIQVKYTIFYLFRFPGLQDGMKAFLSTEMEKVMREEKFLKEEPERLESALRRCKKLTGTLVTLKRYVKHKSFREDTCVEQYGYTQRMS